VAPTAPPERDHPAVDESPPDATFDEDPSLVFEVAGPVTGEPVDRPKPAGSSAVAEPLLERIERIFPGRVVGFVPASVDEEDEPRVALGETLVEDDELSLGGDA
jgi:hypothetical protein